jgi:glutathione S-transferase
MQNVPLLLGAQCSRYSARVRSYLVKKRIAYVERVPTLWTYNVTIARHFGDAAVPVLITPEGEWIADSEIILDRLEARPPQAPILPPDRYTRSSPRWRASGRAVLAAGRRSDSVVRPRSILVVRGAGKDAVRVPEPIKNALVASVACKIRRTAAPRRNR